MTNPSQQPSEVEEIAKTIAALGRVGTYQNYGDDYTRIVSIKESLLLEVIRQHLATEVEKAKASVVTADDFLNYLYGDGNYVDKDWDAKDLEDALAELKSKKKGS